MSFHLVIPAEYPGVLPENGGTINCTDVLIYRKSDPLNRSVASELVGVVGTTLLVLAVPVGLPFRSFASGAFNMTELIRRKVPSRAQQRSGDFDRSVLLTFPAVPQAEAFYSEYHNRPFRAGGAGDADSSGPVCYLLPVCDVTVGPSNLLDEWSRVPACPFCIERIDVSVVGVLTCRKAGWLGSAKVEESGYEGKQQVIKLQRQGSLTCRGCRVLAAPSSPSCEVCQSRDQLWVCLLCGHCGCGRFSLAHAKEHAMASKHRFCLQLGTGRVWDYKSDVFVHRRLVMMAAALNVAPRATGVLELELPDRFGVPELSVSSRHPTVNDRLIAQQLQDEEDLVELDVVIAGHLDYQRQRLQQQLAEARSVSDLRVSEELSRLEAAEMYHLEERVKLSAEIRQVEDDLHSERAKLHSLNTEAQNLERKVESLKTQNTMLAAKLKKQQTQPAAEEISQRDQQEIERLEKEIERLLQLISTE